MEHGRKQRQMKQRWCREIPAAGEGIGNTGMTVHLSWKIAWEIFPRSEFEKQWEWSASMQVQQIRIRNQNGSNCRSLKLQMKYSFRKCHSRQIWYILTARYGENPVCFQLRALYFLYKSLPLYRTQRMPNTTEHWKRMQVTINPHCQWTNSQSLFKVNEAT